MRCDTWVEPGVEVPPFYDPMLAKIVVRGADRAAALRALEAALARTTVAGIETNLAYLRQVVADEVFRRGEQTTRYLNDFRYHASTIDVLAAGTGRCAAFETAFRWSPGSASGGIEKALRRAGYPRRR